MLLLDTNIVSYVLKWDTRIQPYLPVLAMHRLVVSIITIAELRKWQVKHQWGTRRVEQLDALLDQYAVLHIDERLCLQWAQLGVACQDRGYNISPDDMWIAATALHYQLPLVTHNAKHFNHVEGLTVINYPD